MQYHTNNELQFIDTNQLISGQAIFTVLFIVIDNKCDEEKNFIINIEAEIKTLCC